jgi:hypothetical protein
VAPVGQLPPLYPYREGQLLPPGYHLEDRPRQGFVTAGFLVTGIPYGIGLLVAMSANFRNQSGWLALPFFGPWLMMGQRQNACVGRDADSEDASDCWTDLVLIPLLVDGVIQTIGGTFLTIGYLVTKKWAVRDGVSYVVVPSRIGSGYGLSAVGAM